MPNLHAPSRTATRVLLGAFAAVALMAAMSAAAAAEPITSDKFAPGWQSDAQPLFNMGFSTLGNRNKWRVPGILARGDYVLVQRTGDKAQVIQGYRLTVTDSNADNYIFLDPGVSNVEAIPVSDVPSLKPGSGGAWVR